MTFYYQMFGLKETMSEFYTLVSAWEAEPDPGLQSLYVVIVI